MIKVLHIISSLNDGGAEGVLYKIASYDDSQDIEHAVITLTEGEKYRRLLLDKGVFVKELHMHGITKSFLAFFILWLYIIRERPFVVQTWMYHADVIGGAASLLAGVRNIVWNIRSGEIHSSQKLTTRIFIKFSVLLSNFIPRRIVSCSNRAIDIHKKIGYKGSFSLIDNGVNENIFYPSVSKRLKIRSEFSIDDSCVFFGMVARFDPQKDHFNLLQAIANISSHNYKVILVGTNVDSSNVKLLSWIDKLGISSKVILSGQRSDIPDIMCGLDFLILPSLYGEAFPNVLIEAMSVGTPCIATDVGDSARIIGNNGWIVKPKSPSDLSNVINFAINLKINNIMEYNAISEQCINRTKEKFSIESMIYKYKSVWNGEGDFLI